MNLRNVGLNINGIVVHYSSNMLCKSKRARRNDTSEECNSSKEFQDIRSQIYLESWAVQHSDTFTPDGGRRLCVLTETTNKEGRLYLLDSISGAASASGINLLVYCRHSFYHSNYPVPE